MRFLVRLVINTLALLVVASLVPGFIISDWWTAVVAAVVVGLINALLKPILLLITLPVTILTLGLFAFFLNVLLLILAAALVPGFEIQGLAAAIWGAILLSLVSWFLGQLTKG